MKSFFVDPRAWVESETIGSGTKIFSFTHVQREVVIGKDCLIGEQCFLENGTTIGDFVTIKNQVSLWEGITLEMGVFIGPNVVFANDPHPRSRRNPRVPLAKYAPFIASKVLVREGASIGSNATILPGITIGEYALIGAGAVVTRDVKSYELVTGNPARKRGVVCLCGKVLSETRDQHGERDIHEFNSCGHF